MGEMIPSGFCLALAYFSGEQMGAEALAHIAFPISSPARKSKFSSQSTHVFQNWVSLILIGLPLVMFPSLNQSLSPIKHNALTTSPLSLWSIYFPFYLLSLKLCYGIFFNQTLLFCIVRFISICGPCLKTPHSDFFLTSHIFF